MRRDHVTLDVSHADQDGDEQPTLALTVDGPTDLLEKRLVDTDGTPLDREEVDVAFRLQTAAEADDAGGVLSLTNRLTGEFVLEVNADADEVLSLVGTARKDDRDEGRYRVVVRQGETELADYEKRTLLVYDDEGSLLRQHSLIPSGVEL